MTLFSTEGKTFDELRDLITYKNYIDDNDDDNVNLVKKSDKEEEDENEKYEKIAQLIQDFLNIESQLEDPNEIERANISLLQEIRFSFQLSENYPKSLISPVLFEKCFVLLGETNPALTPYVLLLLERIIQCYYDTDISQFFPDEIIEMMKNICNDEENYDRETRKQALKTIFEVYFSSDKAIPLSYHHLYDIFMLTKKIADHICYNKMIDLVDCIMRHFEDAKHQIEAEFFVDFLKESCSWVTGENINAFFRCTKMIFDKIPECIPSLFDGEQTQNDFLNFIIRMLNSRDNQTIVSTLPLIEYILNNTEILTVSHIEMIVECISKLWKTEKYSKYSLQFAGLVIENCSFGVDIMIRNQLVDDISDIFESDSPIDNSTKIEAANVLCLFTRKCERSQFDQVNCDRIAEILEEVESMEVLDQNLIDEAHDNLFPPE